MSKRKEFISLIKYSAYGLFKTFSFYLCEIYFLSSNASNSLMRLGGWWSWPFYSFFLPSNKQEFGISGGIRSIIQQFLLWQRQNEMYLFLLTTPASNACCDFLFCEAPICCFTGFLSSFCLMFSIL